MSAKTLIGKIWTDSVAYVALFAGAGLSIAGNVADTLRVRGDAMDGLDVTMAVVYPALVVLMVEVFVSSRWIGLSWPMQVLRWAGTLTDPAVRARTQRRVFTTWYNAAPAAAAAWLPQSGWSASQMQAARDIMAVSQGAAHQ